MNHKFSKASEVSIVNLGDKIRTLRISNGLTQKKLAEELDITRQAVARWEQNLNMPSAAKLIELS